MSTISLEAKAAALNALQITQASLHTNFPGLIGSFEVSGGGYARQTISVAAAASGRRLMSSEVVFSVPAATTVRWVVFRNTAGDPLFCAPNGGAAPRNFSSSASTGVITAAEHGLTEGQKLVMYQGTPPPPLIQGTIYYARDVTADTFKVSASVGGPAIALTGPPSFGCVVAPITEAVFASNGTHRLTSATFQIPD